MKNLPKKIYQSLEKYLVCVNRKRVEMANCLSMAYIAASESDITGKITWNHKLVGIA